MDSGDGNGAGGVSNPSRPMKIYQGKHPIKIGHHIEWAFDCEGISFFHFTDDFNVPPERAFDAMTVYDEYDMRCEKDYLKWHTQAVDKLLLSNPINVFEIKKLNDQIKERLEMLFIPRILKKLATVYYFDETENPYKWDAAYAEKKIDMFDKMGDNFFLSRPIKDLLPTYNLSENDLMLFSRICQQIDLAHLESISTTLSDKQRNSDLFKRLNSLRNTAQKV